MHKVEMVKLKDLVPDDRNARLHNERNIAEIARSLQELGQHRPFVVQKGTNRVIVGNGMLQAALSLGWAEGLALFVDDDNLTAIRRGLADNRTAELAEWDEGKLAELLAEVESYNTDVPGFSADEINELCSRALEDYEGKGEGTEGLTDPDEVPDVQDEPVSKPGDVWLLGKHRVMCGDSTNIEDMELLTAGQAVDMWLTDPPYNVAYEGKTKDALKIQNDAMDDDSFRQFLRDAYVAADSVMKAGAVFYIWHADSEGYNFRGAARDAGWTVRQCLIWKKQTFVMGRQDYHWKHEPCLYGWKEGAGHLWAADRKQTTVLEFDRPSRNGEHPTMKPVELFEYQMLNNTKGGDIVLDSFGGSGTTVIAAEKNGRVARIMELDPKYCDVIIRRWENFTGGKATLEGQAGR